MSKSQRMTQSQRLSQSQGTPRSQSQGTPRSQPPISSGDLQELARSAVRYLLMNDYNKVPIKHADVVKYVTKNATKNTSQVMQLATKMLREIYGLKLVDDGQSSKHYLLINALKHQDHMDMSPDARGDMILLAIILSFIFMQTNGRWLDSGIEQLKVVAFLGTLQIDPNEIHEYFGDVKKKLDLFKSQKYLDLFRIENTDPPKYEYRWGIRAVEEVSPREALTFASEMYGRERIESWAAHYKAVTEFEGTRAGQR